MAGYTRSIIVGVDDSPSSDAALRWAAAEAVLHDAPLTIVHAVAAPVAAWATGVTPSAAMDWLHHVGAEILRFAEKEAKVLTDGNADVTTALVTQHPAQALVEWSREARMVVVGNRGRGALARRVLGSVSSAVLHQARCPVVITREDVIKASTDPVVLGLDTAAANHPAMTLAFEEAATRGTELLVVHARWSPAIEDLPGPDWEALQLDVDNEVARTLADRQHCYPTVPVRRRVVRGRPAATLVQESESAQLTIVGSRGYGSTAGWLLGSVSNAVVQAAHRPVMVVRDDRIPHPLVSRGHHIDHDGDGGNA